MSQLRRERALKERLQETKEERRKRYQLPNCHWANFADVLPTFCRHVVDRYDGTARNPTLDELLDLFSEDADDVRDMTMFEIKLKSREVAAAQDQKYEKGWAANEE